MLLPLLAALDPQMCRAKYGHKLLATAVHDFNQTLSNGIEDYFAGVRAFAETLYASAAEGRPLFLDKTPRYHLIADELIRCFPDAKFILMWRNPLSVSGSLIHSYGNIWRPHRIHVDLYEGLQKLLGVAKVNPGNMLVMRYEDVVEGPRESVTRISEFLGLELSEAATADFITTKLTGTLGDRSGVSAYKQLSSEPLSKWQQTLSSPVRRRWAMNYLDWIGAQDLAFMGYDYDELKEQLHGLKPDWRTAPVDLARLLYSKAYLKVTGGMT